MPAPLSDREMMSNREHIFMKSGSRAHQRKNLTLHNLSYSFISTNSSHDSFHNSSGLNFHEVFSNSFQTPTSHDFNGSGKVDFNNSSKLNQEHKPASYYSPYDHQTMGGNKNVIHNNMGIFYSPANPPPQSQVHNQFHGQPSYLVQHHSHHHQLNQSCMNFQPVMHDLSNSFTFGDGSHGRDTAQAPIRGNKIMPGGQHDRSMNMSINPQSYVRVNYVTEVLSLLLRITTTRD
jgi:hypothetical protein